MKKIVVLVQLLLLALTIVAQKETWIIDSLKKQLTGAPDTTKTLLLNQLAREYRHSKPKLLLEYALQAKKLAEKSDYKRGIAYSYLNIAMYNGNAGDHKAALGFYNQAFVIANKYHLKDIEHRALAGCGSNILDLNGDYKTARMYYNLALKDTSIVKDYKLMSDILDRIANAYLDQGYVDSASVCHIRALELAEKLKDSTMIARIMINLGMEEAALGNENKQMEYFSESLAIATKIKNKMVASYALLDIGCVWLDRKDYKKATEYLLKSLAFAKELNYKSLEASLYIHLGYVFYAQKNYDKAFDYYNYGFEIAKNNKELLDIIRILNGMGSVMKQKKEYTKAVSYLEKALDENKNNKYIEELTETYLLLSQIYAEQKDYKNAYRYHILQKRLDSIIFNKDREKARAEVLAKYNIEKKTKEILVLKKDNQIKELQLSHNRVVLIAVISIFILMIIIIIIFYHKFKLKRKANEEKDVLLREIHHRVKNNMQIILSLLSLQIRKTNDQQTIDFIKESKSRIQSMALIHERLYQSENLASICFKDYVSQLLDFIYSIYKIDKTQIDYMISSSDIHIDMNTAVPLGLIINEVVCNSIKHGFGQTDFGLIDIRLTNVTSNEYKLIISDTGKGLPENFDIKKTNTLGLKLIQTLTKQIGGELEMAGNKGVLFNIQFKEVV